MRGISDWKLIIVVLCCCLGECIGLVSTAPIVQSAMKTSILLEFAKFRSSDGPQTVGYEISRRTLSNSNWKIVPSIITEQEGQLFGVDVSSLQLNICHLPLCTINVTSLAPGTAYSFRYRALFDSGAWSDFSVPSEYAVTADDRVPTRPRPPQNTAVGSTSAIHKVARPLPNEAVKIIESQYRAVGDTRWSAGPKLTLDSMESLKGDLLLQLENLQPEKAYEIRIRSVNSVGASPFSSASSEFTTTKDEMFLSKPYPPSVPAPRSNYEPIGATWVDMVVRSNTAAVSSAESTKVVYAVEYKSEYESHWHRHPDQVEFVPRRRGVRVVEISTRNRPDSPGAVCSGNFWLRFGLGGNDNPVYASSPPISMTATAVEFAAALRAIPLVQDLSPRIKVQRYFNDQNGFTWRVELEGMEGTPTLVAYRHTMIAELTEFIYGYNSSWPQPLNVSNTSNASLHEKLNYEMGATSLSTSYSSCWPADPRRPVTESVIQVDESKVFEQNRTIRITGLAPQRKYEVRVQLLDERGLPVSTSDATSFATLLDNANFQRLDNNIIRRGQWDLTVPLSRNAREYLSQAANNRLNGISVSPSIISPAVGSAAARQSDFHYLNGVGAGGESGQSGAAGHCVAILFTPIKQVPFHTQRFHYTGATQLLEIPRRTLNDDVVTMVTMKCWGGGGAGGKVSDLVASTSEVLEYSSGGGGAFAQLTFHVLPLDVISITVGGGGLPPTERGGKGGFGGGGDGGSGRIGGGGGGGGGASIVSLNDRLLLVAAGGGGGGSTDYCCARGGAAGALNGESGTSPTDVTPWPISSEASPNKLKRRYEYTSSACPDEAGSSCISVWDTLPASLPAEHLHLQYGRSPTANYSLWATGGGGGSSFSSGRPGISGSFAVQVTGDPNFVMTDGRVAVFTQGEGRRMHPEGGYYLRGGDGGEGKEGGGGGGAGLYGGGGGGSGIDAAGGGGGSSYVNSSAVSLADEILQNARVPTPVVVFVNDTAATIQWTLNWDKTLWGSTDSFDIEYSEGSRSDDFSRIATVQFPDRENTKSQASGNLREFTGNFTITNQLPNSVFRLRVIPIFPKGRGAPTNAVRVETLAASTNYWEPILGRRFNMAASGRGFSDPVVQRPHLDPHVEIFADGVSKNLLRFSDPITDRKPAFPSGRRGHSLSVVDGVAYMFGGRSNGYSCATVLKDMLNLGTPESGLYVYPCSYLQGEVSELWAFDLSSYRWTFLDVMLADPLDNHATSKIQPQPREQHATAVVGNDLYVFGGKTRIYRATSDGYPINEFRSDYVYGDLWKLSIDRQFVDRVTWAAASAAASLLDASGRLAIPQDRQLFVALEGGTRLAIDNEPWNNITLDARSGKCIDGITVSVSVAHDCVNQLRLSLYGPGPQTSSANFHSSSSSHEVLLFANQKSGNLSGCISGTQNLIFDDSAERKLTDEDNVDSAKGYQGRYKPQGRLSEFIGATPLSQWTLMVQDMRNDKLTGGLISWSVDFKLSDCQKTFVWTNLSSILPETVPHRYQAKSLVVGTSIFIYGGRDRFDAPLSDLFRFDTIAQRWTQLHPVDFDLSLDPSTSIGGSFLFTKWGLLRYGGYFRQSWLDTQYVEGVFLQDPVTLRWKEVQVTPWDSKLAISRGTQATNTSSGAWSGATKPRPRYLTGAAFIPTSQVKWSASPKDSRIYYDHRIPSSSSNYAGAQLDSILIFGGYDGASGSVFDGSSGGLLTDMWMLRLANYSTPGERTKAAAYREKHCAVRERAVLDKNSLALSQLGDSCFGSAMSSCSFRDLHLWAWCQGGGNRSAFVK